MPQFSAPHPWDVTPDQAVAIQHELSSKVSRVDRFGEIKMVGGVDVGFEEAGSITRAAVVVLSFPELLMQEAAISRQPTTFPYVPGLLSFREAPAILSALSQLRTTPDLLIVDGQGIAHPRRLGIASHLGVVCDLPAIGVAKSILVGTHPAVANERGAWQPLTHHGELLGAVLRTRPGVRPVYVSIGHRLSLETAISYVLRCSGAYRLPEPTRQAHLLASTQKVLPE